MDTGAKSYYKLSGNRDFMEWVKRRGSDQKIPKAIQKQLSDMPRKYMKRNLWNVYRWTESHNGSSTMQGFIRFLRDVNAWFLNFSTGDADVDGGDNWD